MSNQLAVISDALRSPQIQGRLMLALGFEDSKDPRAGNEAKKYAASVLAELEKMALDKNKSQILNCTPQSISQTMIDAAKFRLMIDGRQHAHIVQYGPNATLQLGYRAYLYKVKEAYPDADITVRPIYEGESVRINDENGFQTYTVQSEIDPFDAKENTLKGVMVAVTYTDNGRLVSKAMPILKNRIDRAQKAAKQDYIWKSDYIEKAKAAAIKAAFKIMFTQIQAVQEMIDFDNKQNYSVEKLEEPEKPEKSNIIDNLNSQIIEQPVKLVEENKDSGDDLEESEESSMIDYVPQDDMFSEEKN